MKFFGCHEPSAEGSRRSRRSRSMLLTAASAAVSLATPFPRPRPLPLLLPFLPLLVCIALMPVSLSIQDELAEDEEDLLVPQVVELHFSAMKERAFIAPPLKAPSDSGESNLLRPHSKPFAVIREHDVRAESKASLCPTCMVCPCCTSTIHNIPPAANCCVVWRNTIR